jgi:NAD(P)-dependent dehydrogenase (short-subunit alcohol dehydrogenase family)
VISWSPAERISGSFSASILLIRAVLKESRKRFNVAVIHVDFFVNNAGFSQSGEFLSHDPRQEQAEVEVNVQVLVALTHHFAKAMAARGRAASNATSNAGFQSLPYMATYAATKAFVLHFSGPYIASSPQGCTRNGDLPGPSGDQFLRWHLH